MAIPALFCAASVARPAKGSGGGAACHWHKGQWANGGIMSAITVQESFLNVALAGGKHITVHLLNGAQVSGNVRSFDKYSIVLETKTQEQLIFKHSVSALLVCCRNKHCTETCKPD
jgi:RNA chaperone Hfq